MIRHRVMTQHNKIDIGDQIHDATVVIIENKIDTSGRKLMWVKNHQHGVHDGSSELKKLSEKTP